MARPSDDAPVALGPETLYAVIGAVAQGPDLDRVLPAVVDLLVDATACHACFVYLREDDVLRMRAASPVFAHAVGRVTMGLDEGLTGWVARHRTPAFIREAAFEDPRMKYVPELEEERFQSMVAVPLLDRADDVIGVVVLHTQAPREFGQDVLDFLVHVASLVAGAIDNARLYEQTRRQVAALSALADLSQELASLTGREELYAAGVEGVARLLGCRSCRLLLLDAGGRQVEVAATPQAGVHRDDALVHAPSDGRLVARLLEHDAPFGVLAAERDLAFSADDVQLLEACVNQLAVALRKAELIERLAAENLVRDVFEALEQGAPPAAAARARAIGWDPARPHVVVVATPLAGRPSGDVEVGERVESRLRFAAPNALSDVGPDRLRALVPLGAANAAGQLEQLTAELGRIAREEGVAVGISQLRRGLADDVRSLSEATDAARITAALDPDGGARPFATLGAYRYLASLAGSHVPDAVHARVVATLSDYDAQRRTDLVATLEQYLTRRGSVVATAGALTIHANTLRQRLQRIEELTGLVLEDEDLLSLELALKLHRLRATAPAS
jgi:GAF domain-containing protein